MFTMAEGGRFVTDWAGDPGAVDRLRRPVLLHGRRPRRRPGHRDHRGGVIEEKLEDKRVVVALTAKANDSRVLSKARAVVQLS